MAAQALARDKALQVGKLPLNLYILSTTDIGPSKRVNTIRIFERSLAGNARDQNFRQHVAKMQGARSCPPTNLKSYSFRTFLQVLKQHGRIVEINGHIDPYLALSNIDLDVYQKKGIAFLFNSTSGMNDGFCRLLGIPSTLGYDFNTDDPLIVSDLGNWVSPEQDTLIGDLVQEYSESIVPVILKDGPCKEKKLMPNQVDLTTLPTISNRRVNGARHIELYGMLVINLPTAEWANWRMVKARVVSYDQLKIGSQKLLNKSQLVSVQKNTRQHIPCSFCLGVSPTLITAASSPLSGMARKAQYVGVIEKGPLKLVKCDTNDLLVPATCEIVFEGLCTVPPHVAEECYECGTKTSYLQRSNLDFEFTIKLITHRDNAIMPVPLVDSCD